MSNSQASRTATAEQRLNELGIQLPAPPQPFGAYVEAVQAGHLLFLTGMLPTVGREAKFIGRVGAEFDVEAGRQAARLAATNGLALTREHSCGTFARGAMRHEPRMSTAPRRLP